MELKDTRTRENLMRAFAGESQARNRYTFAAGQAAEEKQYVLEAVFRFTADQEKEHAQLFYEALKDEAGSTIFIDGGFPVDYSEHLGDLLRMAEHNEKEEADHVYQAFGDVAKEENFPGVASMFYRIAAIEETHRARFAYFAELVEQGRLYVSDTEEGWMCLNCGHRFTGKEAPSKCPVCHHDQGYFIRMSLAPWTCEK